jgi:SAM-dependent methyltransferase
MVRRSSAEVMNDILDLDGATVVDVGCGDGWLTRRMTRQGAVVTGIEVSPKQLAAARAVAAVGSEHYIQGLAEELPIPSRSADIVVYFNSFHHVDEVGLPRALREAARVLKLGGILYVAEPMPEGPYFELMKPAHDETVVRDRAQDALRHAPEYRLLLEKTLVHIDTVTMRSFEAFHDRITSINPQVRERFAEEEEQMRESFIALSRETPDGRQFDQPMRVTVLRRS